MATYKINIRRQLYGPHKLVSALMDPSSDREWRGTRAAARALIQSFESERYYLAHNESGRPIYRIARAD